MTPTPLTIDPETLLSAAAEIMREQGIRHLPVVQNGDLLGVLSERDVNVVRCLHTVTLDTVNAGKIMHEAPFSVLPDTPLADVAAQMAKKRYGSAIVEEGGEVVGIFTTVDGLRALNLLCALESPG